MSVHVCVSAVVQKQAEEKYEMKTDLDRQLGRWRERGRGEREREGWMKTQRENHQGEERQRDVPPLCPALKLIAPGLEEIIYI